MKFNFKNPLRQLADLSINIWDFHVHIWDAGAFLELEKWAHIYGVKKFLGIAQPDVKKNLEENGKAYEIVFAYYLPMQAFAEHKPTILLDAIDEAYENEYKMVKLWFGPRFLDFFNANKPFTISNQIFDPVFGKIEDYRLAMDIHIADPDIWYETKYSDSERYRTKSEAIDEFLTVLHNHSSIPSVGVHFGSLPEINNLEKLSKILDGYPNFFIDTASTKWILRELGKDPKKARKFIIDYQSRVLFATDLSCGWGNHPENYYATRYWSQRLFWETNFQKVKLPFPDDDNPNPPTFINGLQLPRSILKKLYYDNAEKFLSN